MNQWALIIQLTSWQRFHGNKHKLQAIRKRLSCLNMLLKIQRFGEEGLEMTLRNDLQRCGSQHQNKEPSHGMVTSKLDAISSLLRKASSSSLLERLVQSETSSRSNIYDCFEDMTNVLLDYRVRQQTYNYYLRSQDSQKPPDIFTTTFTCGRC